jgi:hypothetical protein
MVGCCDHAHEPLSFIKSRTFLDWLKNQSSLLHRQGLGFMSLPIKLLTTPVPSTDDFTATVTSVASFLLALKCKLYSFSVFFFVPLRAE